LDLLDACRNKSSRRFLAVFADVDGDLDGGGEVHAYLPGDTLKHAPLLTLKARPLCACTHAALGELVLASETHIRAHALRGWDDGRLKAPQRLAIELGAAQALVAVAASDVAGVIVAASKAGGFWCWDASRAARKDSSARAGRPREVWRRISAADRNAYSLGACRA